MTIEEIDAAQKAHVDKLSSAFAVEQSKSTFTCGGKLLMTTDPVATTTTPLSKTSASGASPVTIRFGPDGTGSVLILPASEDTSALYKLLSDCAPASFGVGSKEVLDEEYHKAKKLDTDAFCTSFCPYTSGIVNIVNQLLLPSVDSQRCVKAELYKLNVYSSPSGRFKPHVDTPRDKEQVGSLVVSLPSAFAGGSLSVRNRDQIVVFDWTKNATTSIQWAAFYSDCEHEVHEVTAGHRITLTYNLMLVPRVDLQAGADLSLDAKTLPFAKMMSAAIADPRFMFRGGEVGIFLTHRYPHTHKVLSKLLPRCLKGVDMAIYEAARALGLSASLICTSKQSTSSYYYDDEDAEDSEGEELHRIGSYIPRLKTLETGGCVGDDGDDFDMDGARPMYAGRFFWLNKAGYKELSKAALYYGNEPDIELQYVSAALLIRIPDAADRYKGGVCAKEDYCEVADQWESRYDEGASAQEEQDEDEDEDDDDEVLTDEAADVKSGDA